MKGSWKRVREVRVPACSAGAVHAVLVDPDDRADRGALGAFEAGEGTVEIGRAEALLGEEGLASGLSGG